jgi:amino acid adenylation domain-containing protein
LKGRTFAEDLTAAAERDPERIVLITAERPVSAAELDERASHVAAALAELGVERGDRVAVVLPNGFDSAVAIYGALRAGAAFSPVNPTIKRDRLAALLGDLGAKVVICDEDRAETVRAAAQIAGEVTVISRLAGFGSDEPSDLPLALEVDLAAVIYTSGSTGEAKGVTLSHRNMTFVADSIIEYLELTDADRVLCVLPLSFNYGLYQLFMCVRTGATLVLEPGFAYPGRVVGLLEEQRISVFAAVPTIYQTLLSLNGLRDHDFPDLRCLTNAGAALPAATVAAVRETFPGARLFLMYGLTEATRVAYLPPELVDRKPSAVGNPIPGTEVWLEDEDGNVVAQGEVGELIVRGPHVMQGYWNNVQGDAIRLRPGRWPWERVLATNDLFRQDEDGHLQFISRRDDVIKSRGEKVAPREVEEVLCLLPGIREAAVVGVPDPRLGHAVVAHVTAVDGADLDPATLRRLCLSQLEDYKVPRRVVVHDALPRSGNGKVDRAALIALNDD